jgi:hypothetical protein
MRAVAGQLLDFASDVPEQSEFLRQVVAFANADGGDFYLGLQGRRLPKTGLRRVTGAPGIRLAPEQALAQFHSWIPRIEPPLAEIGFSIAASSERGPVIAVRVPASHAAPHRIDGSFVMRRGAAIHVMTDDEVMAVRVARRDVFRRVREFVSERLDIIRRGRVPLFLNKRVPLFVVHLMPRTKFTSHDELELAALTAEHRHVFRPLRSQLGRDGIDADALVARDGKEAYTIVWPDGGLEAVYTAPHNERLRQVFERNMARDLREAIPRFAGGLTAAGVSPPMFLCGALLDAERYSLAGVGLHLTSDTILYDPHVVYGDTAAATHAAIRQWW